eukprot:SAG31_NODE_4217_length_3451_cov_1.999106_2_plen_79_part_00
MLLDDGRYDGVRVKTLLRLLPASTVYILHAQPAQRRRPRGCLREQQASPKFWSVELSRLLAKDVPEAHCLALVRDLCA